MDFFLRSTIILILFTNAYTQICEVNLNQLLCNNIIILKSEKLIVHHSNVQSIKFLNSNISTIPAGFFIDSLTNTVTIYLNNSGVNKIEPGAFEGLTHLKELNLYSNNIQEIKPGTLNSLTNLKILNLNYNKIFKLEPGTFDSLVNLEELNFHKNKISVINPGTFNSLLNLKTLNLQGNYLSQINNNCFANMTNLQTVNLNNNNLQCIQKDTFNDLPNLENLFMSYNRINHLDEDFLNNQKKLLKLHLDNNLLKTINHKLLSNLPNLAYVHLENNKITAVSLNSFSKHLIGLFISENQVTTFDIASFLASRPNFRFISLNNNKWECDTLKDMVQRLLNHSVLITDRDTKNSTNIDGIACSETVEDFETFMLEEDQDFSQKNYCNYDEMILTRVLEFGPKLNREDPPPEIDVMIFQTTEKNENYASSTINNKQDFYSNVTQNINETLNEFKVHYFNFSNNTTILMLIIILLLVIIVIILIVILCRTCCTKKSSKIEKNTEMATCRYSNLSFM